MNTPRTTAGIKELLYSGPLTAERINIAIELAWSASRLQAAGERLDRAQAAQDALDDRQAAHS